MSWSHWYKVEQLPWPADWVALFGRDAPLLVEIGFGSGLFLVDLARRRPEANVLGLEISIPAVRNAGRKVARGNLTNVVLMQAHAPAALQALCRPGSLAAVIINFPDPWPKKDQLGRRLIDDQFLQLLATRMEPGAPLDIATDETSYAEQIADCLQSSSHFTSRLPAPYLLDDPERLRTKYEQIALSAGRLPRYFKWQRNETPAADRFPIPQEYAMPHVVLRLPADPAEIGRRFRPAVLERETARIRFIESYQSLRDGKLLIETYINEDPILQRIGLEVRARPKGEIVIALAELGFPRPTRGVHLAIGALVEWLRQEFPSLIVVHSTLQEAYDDRAG
jgi:tRNA (guanine-N7-)-methyltransferase